MIPVEHRNQDSFLSIIMEWILPGTTIISDFWRAYDCLDQEGYQHLKVNDSLSFKNPDTRAHTYRVKLACCKSHFYSFRTTKGLHTIEPSTCLINAASLLN